MKIGQHNSNKKRRTCVLRKGKRVLLLLLLTCKKNHKISRIQYCHSQEGNHGIVTTTNKTYSLKVCTYMNNTTEAICGAGSAYPSGTLEINPVSGGVRVAHFLVFFVGFCV